jgi:hypothetical protein
MPNNENEEDSPLLKFLKGIPVVNAALAAAAGAISATIMQKTSLVPINLDWLSGAGIVVAIIALLLVAGRAFGTKARPWLFGVLCLSAAATFAMQIFLVETFDFYGESFRELRGWKLTPYGETLKANLEKSVNSPLTLHDVIYYSDHTLMPQLFGDNWYIAACMFSVAILALVFSFVALLGLIGEIPKKAATGT